MCDYSLEHVKSRKAKVGDKLVSTKFTNSITRGFAAINEPNVAVCLLPGTEIKFDGKDVGVRAFIQKPARRIPETVARFREINLEDPHTHHDALEFPSGEFVLVTSLCEEQVVTVLQLPAQPGGGTGTVEAEGTGIIQAEGGPKETAESTDTILEPATGGWGG
jgi:hypothetical protein